MQQQLHRISPLPSDLDSSEAKLVYLYIQATDGATVDDLNETLVMKKMAVLSVLNSLSSDGFVERVGNRYMTKR